MTLADKPPHFAYASPAELDVTKLKNYVAPENTLEAENHNWANAKSRFYTFAEYHIFAEACVRRKPTDVEIRTPEFRMTDAQHDALLSLEMTHSCAIELDAEDAAVIKAMNIEAYYRYSSITHNRNRPGMAVIIAGELIIAF